MSNVKKFRKSQGHRNEGTYARRWLIKQNNLMTIFENQERNCTIQIWVFVCNPWVNAVTATSVGEKQKKKNIL